MKKYLIISLILFIFVVGFVIYCFKPESVFKDTELTSIEFSYGGGYGTVIDTCTKYIIIQNNGLVTFKNSYNDLEDGYYINIDDYKELESYIIDNKKIFVNKPKEDYQVLDGNSSHLKIITLSNKEYKIGGYSINDDIYNEIINKIFDTIDSEKFNDYVNKIK